MTINKYTKLKRKKIRIILMIEHSESGDGGRCWEWEPTNRIPESLEKLASPSPFYPLPSFRGTPQRLYISFDPQPQPPRYHQLPPKKKRKKEKKTQEGKIGLYVLRNH